MPVLAFPVSPVVDQVYGSGSKTWKWDGVAWRVQRTVAAPGLSAYQIAISQGFVGTEADWLESLNGDPGPPGSGLPSGGTGGQLLAKNSATDGDTEWIDPPEAITSLAALTDVDTTTTPPTDGQGLIWNQTNTKWEPADTATGPDYYKITGFFTASPLANEILQIQSVDEAFVFSANFTGSTTKLIGTAPSAPVVLSVRKNAVTEIGTITINTDGTIALATTGGTTVSIAIGDGLSIHAPALTDVTTNFSWTLRGIKS